MASEEASVSEKAKPSELLTKIRVLVVDARAPFPELAIYSLDAVPQARDNITIGVNGRPVGYRVEFVNCNPFDARTTVTIGVLPNLILNTQSIDIKNRMDQYVKGQIQVWEKAQAYTNAMILAGYAGTFALWTFAKPTLSSRASNIVLLLVGFSIILFVSWELISMIVRARLGAKFLANIQIARRIFSVADATRSRKQGINRKLSPRMEVCSNSYDSIGISRCTPTFLQCSGQHF